MVNIEQGLDEARKHLEKLETPEDLEFRLKEALFQSKRKTNIKYMLVASIIISLIFISAFNYPVIAYYGRKILGFEQLTYGTLADLNNQGMGQIVNKTYIFKNGMKVTLDGVMIDENQLVAFYTVKDPSGNSGYDLMGNLSFKGFWGNYGHQFGSGITNDDGTEVKWIDTFSAPKALERSLTFQFSAEFDNQIEHGEIQFILDRSKAMGHTIKQNINKTIKTKEGNIIFEHITASPTITKITGELKGMDLSFPEDLSKDSELLPNFDTVLIVDGEILESRGRGITNNILGTKFTFEFEGFLNSVESMEVLLYENVINESINHVLEFATEHKGLTLVTGEREFKIYDIYSTTEGIYVTLESEVYFNYYGLSMIINEEKIYPARVEGPKYIRNDAQNHNVFRRTYFFENDTTENALLKFESIISYIEFHSDSIEILVK